MSNVTLPTLVLAGERDNPEGHRVCQPSVPQRPGHCGKAVHRLGGLLHRPLGPLPRIPRSPVGCRTSNMPLCLGRKGWDEGRRWALISAAHPKDHSQVPGPLFSRQVVLPAKTRVLHLPLACLPSASQGPGTAESIPFQRIEKMVAIVTPIRAYKYRALPYTLSH